mgnify:CR=1 FL=1
MKFKKRLPDLNAMVYKSLLYVPANRPRMQEKARVLPCDAVIFDLEDSVAIEEKTEARETLKDYLAQPFPKPFLIRVNAVDTEFFRDDLSLLEHCAPQAIVLPKANRDSLVTAGSGLDELGPDKRSIGILPLIENALDVKTVLGIMEASARVIGAQLGAEDLTADLEIRRTEAGGEISYARHRVVYGARAMGCPAFDTPFVKLNNLQGLKQDCREARRISFSGKTCIHPSQLETVNRIFSPSTVEIDSALRIIEAVKAHEGGVFSMEGRMIDEPVIERARQILRLADVDR